MALLNHAEGFQSLADRKSVRLNWRLILAMGATAGFWIVLAQGVARLF